ncbi:FG-GAP-like repeat-containing protein [Paludibaculum fermentans]|uniref:FG-GAP-like repeat-containing protein n=1 Tax=Paludibaculum fermentans TaxID=1473598 RepID=UPI003EC09569
MRSAVLFLLWAGVCLAGSGDAVRVQFENARPGSRVTFLDGASVLGVGTVGPDGIAAIPAKLAPGRHEVRAVIWSSGNSLGPVQRLAVPTSGRPEFQARHPLQLADPAQALAVADLNRDGLADAVVATSTGVYLLAGRGNGDFDSGSNVFGRAASAVAICDFDGDGSLDLAVAAAAGIAVLRGDGQGGFQAGDVLASSLPQALVVADFTGDGIPDLADAGVGLRVYPGKGNLTFGSPVIVDSVTHFTSLAAADFDRDGILDLAASAARAPRVAVFRGRPGLGFALAAELNAGGPVAELGVFSASGGSGPHLLLRISGSDKASLMANEGGMAFRTPVSVEGLVLNSGTVQSADLNGDGALDQIRVLDATGRAASDIRAAGRWSIVKTHQGQFYRGLPYATFQIIVNGPRQAPEVFDTLPAGLTLLNAYGPAWECITDSGPLHCWGYGELDQNGNFPPLTVEVSVDQNAPLTMTNTATVTDGATSSDTIVLPSFGVADLTISKTHTDPFTPGQVNAQYEITVSNVGNSATNGSAVGVQDTLPAGLTATSLTGNGWNCTLATLSCVRGDVLAAGASYPKIVLLVTVASNASTFVTNEATVSGGGDYNPANNIALDYTSVLQPDLSVFKTHSGQFQRGQQGVQYTIFVTNTGGLDVTGTTTLTEQPPAGLTITGLAGAGWNCSLALLTCTIASTLAPGSSYNQVNVTADVSANAPPLLANAVSVSNASDADPSNNTYSDPTSIDVLGPDLTLDKSHTGSFTAGQGGQYLLTVSNLSAYPITSIVTVTETPPAGMTVTGMSGSGWNCNTATLLCTAPVNGGVLPASPITVTVLVDANASGTLTNQAAVSGGGDVYAGNNSDSDPTSVQSQPAGVDLRISKSHTGNFRQGQLDGHYTLHVSNLGSAEPTGNVTVTENPPAGMVVTSMSSMLWTCNTGSCTAPPATYTTPINVTVHVDPNAPALLTNQASVSTSGDVDLSNNTAQDDTVIEPASPDLTITKSHTGDFARGQNGVTYTLLVSNVGNAPSYGTITVTEAPPAGLTITAISGQNWSCSLATLSCTNLQQFIIPPGSPAQPITVTANVSTTADDLINQATVSGGGDATPGNNTASDPTHITGPNLRITKTHNGNFYQGQLNAVYTIGVTNVGDSEPTGSITVQDIAPQGMTVTSMSSLVWTCNAGSCTAPPSTYTAPITVTARIDPNAPAQLTNRATVSTSGDIDPSNNTADDPATIDPASPDLTITKTHTGNFARGQNGVTYTLLVSNVGNAPSYGTITVTEAPPAGLTITAISGQNWSCSLATLSCTNLQQFIIPPGSSAQPIAVTANVDLNAAVDLVNQASVSGGGDATPGNNGASDPTHTTGPNLRITKTHNGNFYQGQLNAVYTIGVTNVGESEPAGSITVQDIAPQGMTVSSMSSLVWTCNAGSCTAPPATYTAPITVTVHIDPNAPAQLTNTATVSTAGDSDTSNNTAQDPTTIDPASPNLTLAKTHVGNFARGQNNVTYSLTVSNTGNAPSYGTITVTEAPPAGLTITSISGQNWSCSLATLSCTNLQQFVIPPGSPAQPITVTANVSTTAAADLINQATVSGGGDATPGNNTAADPTHITGPNLRITKTHNGNFHQGQLNAVYTIGVTNVGDSEPTGSITVQDIAPQGMTVTSMSSLVWTCNAGSCTAPPSTYTAPITVTARIDPNAPAQLTNRATVSTSGDIDPSNNTADDPATIDPASPDLTITKTHTGNFARGQNGVTYTLLVSNVGNAPSYGTITVTEAPPAGLTITAISGQNWSCSLATLSCTNLQQFIIPPGSSAQPIIVTANVNTSAPADFINQAVVSGGGDTSLGNNTGSDPTHTTGPNLRITKTHNGNFSQGQLNAVYTIAVTNVGESEPTGSITVQDIAPQGMTVTSMSSLVWTCNAGSCTAPPATYTAPITVTVRIDPNAPAQLTNTATVSTVGDSDTSNNTAQDPTTIDPASPNLTLAKTHTGNFARGQNNVTYSLTVSNTGNAPSYGTITVTEAPPAGLTITSISGQNWSCSLATLSCTNLQQFVIPPGSPAQSITVTANVSTTAASDLINQATVSGGGDATPGNNTAADPTHITGPNLRITKTHNGNFHQGQLNAVYTIGVTNVGDSEPTGSITVQDIAPQGMTVTSMSSLVWTCNAGSCTAPPSTYTAPITVTARIDPNAPAQLTNRATVSTSGDIDPSNNTADDPATIDPASPDLTITKTHTGNFARGQNGVTYTLLVSNVGNAPSYGTITVTEAPPAGLTITAISGQNWSCSLATLSCTNLQQFIIPPGSPAQPIIVTANVNTSAPADFINQAVVSGGGDTSLGNNTGSDPTHTTGPNLRITKTHTGNFSQGQLNAVYTLSVTNVGESEPTGSITVRDIAPQGMTVASMSSLVWTCNAGSCTAPPSTYTAPITVTVRIDPTAPAQLTNTATVSTPGDVDTSNNTAQDPTSIDPAAPDLTVTKSHAGTFARGQAGVTYTLLVSNVGNAPSYGTITVTEAPPAGLTITAISGQNWSCSVATRSCTNLQQFILAPGSSAQPITVTANVDYSAPVEFLNQAAVSGGGDTTPGNNTASDPTRTTGPDLRITKTHTGNFRQGQLAAHYTIQVVNDGDGPPTGTIRVTEIAPPGMTVASMSSPAWVCANLTCSTTAATLATPIDVTVRIDSTAAGVLTNTATVATDGDPNTSNNTAQDLTIIEPAVPDLIVNKSHAANFTQGQLGASYTISVINVGTGPTAGTVTVADVLPPSGLAATSIGGAGWACVLATLTCTRNDSLPSGSVYPPVTVLVDVATNAPANLTNQAQVSGGGEVVTLNNTSIDATSIVQTTLNVTVTPGLPVLDRVTGRLVQSVSIQNNGPNLTASALVLDSLGAGLTLFAPSGFTAATLPAGSPFVEAGPITSGAAVVVRLEFTRIGAVPITYTPRVLGPGPR